MTVTVTGIGSGAPDSFNLLGYTTVNNYSPARWTVTLPPRRVLVAVSNDTLAKLIFLQYQFVAGTLVTIR